MSDEIIVTPKSAPAATSNTTTEGLQTLHAPTLEVESGLSKLEVATQLGVRDTNDHKFEFVFDELSKDGATKGEILVKIRDIERKMGMPRYGLGENKLGLLFNYLKAERALSGAAALRNSYLA